MRAERVAQAASTASCISAAHDEPSVRSANTPTPRSMRAHLPSSSPRADAAATARVAAAISGFVVLSDAVAASNNWATERGPCPSRKEARTAADSERKAAKACNDAFWAEGLAAPMAALRQRSVRGTALTDMATAAEFSPKSPPQRAVCKATIACTASTRSPSPSAASSWAAASAAGWPLRLPPFAVVMMLLKSTPWDSNSLMALATASSGCMRTTVVSR